MINAGLPPAHISNQYNLYENVAYDEYWQRTDRQKLNQLEHAIVKKLLPLSGKRMIDLGCGYGRLADCYLDRFEISVLFDGSRTLLQAAQKNTQGKALYVWGDINHLPFKSATFDCALMVRTFHHIDDAEDCMRNLRRVLRVNGSLIMNYSNKRNFYRILKSLLGKNSHNPFSFEPDTTEPNFIHHHPDHVRKILESSGFVISDCQGSGILDKLAAITPSFLFPILPSGELFAPFFGKLLLSPWIFIKASLSEGESLSAISNPEELFICPSCGSSLIRYSSGFYCPGCRINYPMDDDIIDMRVAKEK